MYPSQWLLLLLSFAPPKRLYLSRSPSLSLFQLHLQHALNSNGCLFSATNKAYSLSFIIHRGFFSLVICSLQFILFAYSFSLECSASMLRLICALYTILYDVIVIVVVVVFGFMRSFISDCLGSFATCNFTTPYTNFFFSTSFFKFKSI